MLKQFFSREKPRGGPVRKGDGLGLFNPLAWLFFLGFSVPGIAIAVAMMYANWLATDRISWVESKAVVGSEFDDFKKIEDEKDLSYSYRFEGKTFEGEGVGARFFFIDSDEIDRKVRQLARTIPKKQPVPVWVNPREPEQSSLVKWEMGWIGYFLAIFAFSHGAMLNQRRIITRQGEHSLEIRTETFGFLSRRSIRFDKIRSIEVKDSWMVNNRQFYKVVVHEEATRGRTLIDSLKKRTVTSLTQQLSLGQVVADVVGHRFP